MGQFTNPIAHNNTSHVLQLNSPALSDSHDRNHQYNSSDYNLRRTIAVTLTPVPTAGASMLSTVCDWHPCSMNDCLNRTHGTNS